MRPIKTLVVEDQWIISEEISEQLKGNGMEVVGQAEDASTALKIMRDNPADIALLDININGHVDGIELGKLLIKEFHCAIIFLTAFDDENIVSRAKRVKPAAYIVKPFESKNLLLAVEMAFNNLLQEASVAQDRSFVVSDFIFLKDQHRFKKVEIATIKYVEAEGSYISIFTDQGRHTLAINLKTFEQNLDHHQFLRIHRSYLINTARVEAYEGNQVFIDGLSLPISQRYKEDFVNSFKFF